MHLTYAIVSLQRTPTPGERKNSLIKSFAGEQNFMAQKCIKLCKNLMQDFFPNCNKVVRLSSINLSASPSPVTFFLLFLFLNSISFLLKNNEVIPFSFEITSLFRHGIFHCAFYCSIPKRSTAILPLLL